MVNYVYQNVAVEGAGQDIIASGINDLGEISGTYVVGPSAPYPQAFTELNGFGLVSFGTGPGGQQSHGYGVNNQGWLAMQSGKVSAGLPRGWLYEGSGGYQRVSLGWGDTTAYDINDKQETVGGFNPNGVAVTGQPGLHGFIWKPGTATQLLDHPGATWTVASSISDTDVVVGTWGNGPTWDPNSVEKPFVYDHGKWKDINVHSAIHSAVKAEANGISPDGKEIVGNFQDAAGFNHGWIMLQNHISEIHMDGATNVFINDVNDFKQIVGNYTVAGDTSLHSFVATPEELRPQLPKQQSMPQVVHETTGLAAGNMYYDFVHPFIAGISTTG